MLARAGVNVVKGVKTGEHNEPLISHEKVGFKLTGLTVKLSEASRSQI